MNKEKLYMLEFNQKFTLNNQVYVVGDINQSKYPLLVDCFNLSTQKHELLEFTAIVETGADQ
jgi:hypothetical protein